MAADLIPLAVFLQNLSPAELITLASPAIFARGSTYASTGRVGPLEITSVDGDHQMRAQVQGTGGVTYQTTLVIHRAPGKTGWYCSCPYPAFCKHLVALILVAQKQLSSISPGAWREILNPLLQVARETPKLPLALGMSLRRMQESGELSITPLRQTKLGTWTTVRASWENLTSRWSSVTDDIDPSHLAIIRELHRLAREQTWFTPKTISLGNLGPHALTLLSRGRAQGVELVDLEPPHRPIALLETPAKFVLDIASGDAGGLEVTGSIAHWSPDSTQLPIGEPPFAILVSENGEDNWVLQVIAPADGPLASFFATGTQLEIPAVDRAEFQLTFLPALAARMQVKTAPDVSLEQELKVKLRGELVVTDQKTANATWELQASLGTSVVTLPADNVLPTATIDLIGKVQTVLRGWVLAQERCETIGGTDFRQAGDLGGLNLSFPVWMVPEFLAEIVPQLNAIPDVIFDISTEAEAIQVDDGAAAIGVSLTDSAERDWFDLKVTVKIAGQEMPLEQVLLALAAGQEHLEIQPGHWISLDGRALRRLRELLAEAREIHDWASPTQGNIGIYDLGFWQDLTKEADQVVQSARWHQRVGTLAKILEDGAATALPSAHDLVLRPYQVAGVAWLQAVTQAGLGGILADEMGLGKTVQLLTILAANRKETGERRPALVIAPTSVVDTWAAEAARFYPEVQVVTVTATERRRGHSLTAAISDADLVISTYTLVRLEREQYQAVSWSGVVLDEAQAVKNPSAKVHAAVRGLPSDWKIAVTGTPVENSLLDLWALFSITCPGLLGSRKDFSQRYRSESISKPGSKQLQQLHARTRPFLLRRTKDEVALDLPEKVEQVLRLELSSAHRRAYDRLLARERQRILGLLDDVAGNQISILSGLTRLRQMSLDSALLPQLGDPAPAVKVDYLTDKLAELVGEGHNVLVFSQFTSFLARIEAALTAAKISYTILTGTTRDRAARIAEFRSGEKPVFLISLKAGGVGLTLTEADYVFVADPWWNPAAEEQAVDRAHRIGQRKRVNVYRLIAKDTIEEKVQLLQESKRALIDAVVDGGGAGRGKLNAEDIRALLA